MKIGRIAAVCCALLVAACISVRQQPATFENVAASNQRWVLNQDVKVRLQQGSSTPLRKGSVWQRIGRIPQGDVLQTKDQVVTVEASNQYEAYVVVSAGMIAGFYLPVEKTFTPADPPAAFVADLK